MESFELLDAEEEHHVQQHSNLAVTGKHGSPAQSAAETSIVEADDIDWRYLTYETELPHFAAREGARDGSSAAPQPPPMPDLSSYGNPLDWSKSRKDALIFLSCIATLFTAYSAGSYAPAIPQIMVEFTISRVGAEVGITIFTIGFAVAPMILAPFSEINGRRPIFLITGALFVVFVLCCGLTQIYAGMLVSRFLGGFVSSTFSTMVGGVVADIYVAEERNRPMTLFTFGALFGTGIGPLVSGFIAYHVSWRWVFYVHTIIIFVLAVALLIVFKETRGAVLLSRKAKKLNCWHEEMEAAGFWVRTKEGLQEQSQRVRYKVKADEERASLWHMIRISLVRPFHMLFTEPVVVSLAACSAFCLADL